MILFVCVAWGSSLYAQKAPNLTKSIIKSKTLQFSDQNSIDSVYYDLLKKKTKPIIILDGEVTDLSPFQQWDASRIKLVEVLSKEEAILIYGADGAKGVIRFTPKPHKDGLSSMNYTGDDGRRPGPEKKDNRIYDSKTPNILMASFPRGIDAFNAFMKEKTVYPEEAKRNKIKGKVYLSFIVEKYGEITNIKIDKGLGYGLDEEAKRLIALKRWNPAILNGHPTRVSYQMPIEFILE